MNTVIGLPCTVVKLHIGKGATNTYWGPKLVGIFFFIYYFCSQCCKENYNLNSSFDPESHALSTNVDKIKEETGMPPELSPMPSAKITKSELLSLWTQMELWILNSAFQVIDTNSTID